MNFAWTQEQQQLIDSVTRLLQEQAGFQKRALSAQSEAGFNPQVWRHLVDLGLTALPLAPEDGGLGGSAVDLLAVQQVFGSFLVLEPWISCGVVAAKAISLCASSAERSRLLTGVIDGSILLAWAHAEAGSLGAEIQSRARADASGLWHVRGEKEHVIHAQSADYFIVTAHPETDAGEASPIQLFLVERGEEGVEIEPYRLLDDTPAGTLRLTNVRARALAPSGESSTAQCIRVVESYGILAACAQALGAAQAAYDLARGYLGTRTQFGRPLSANQALRHTVAEMLMALEMCRSMAMLAAIAIDSLDDAQRERELSQAKYLVGKYARSICQSAIQLHGAIGITLEAPVGHYLRKVMVLDQQFGSPELHALHLTKLDRAASTHEYTQ